MGFNIDAFKANGLVYGGARPSLFEVRLKLPDSVTGGGNNGSNTVESKIRFLAQTTSLPASTISPIDVMYFGRPTKFAGDRVFDNWTLTVLNDEDFRIRASMEAWLNGINTHISNRRSAQFGNESYKTSATVYQLAKTGNGTADVGTAIRAYTFSGLFPIVLGDIPLSYAATNQIESFTVTFSCDYWVPGDSEEGNPNSFNGVDGSATPWDPKLRDE